MKMVSAAKYAQAERRLKPARAYGSGCVDVYDKTGAEGPEDAPSSSLSPFRPTEVFAAVFTLALTKPSRTTWQTRP